MKKNLLLLSASLLTLATSSASAAIVFFEDFNGTGSALNGTTAETNTLGNAATTWNASTLFLDNGTLTAPINNMNLDRGAWLDLGEGALQANTTYTITLDYSSVAGGIAYFGLVDIAAPNTGIRAQNQGVLALGGAVRNFSTRQELNLYGFPTLSGGTGEEVTGTGITYAASGTLTATLVTNNLTDATITVGGQTRSINATGLNQVLLGWETGNNTAGGIQLNSLTIETVPEPSISLLGGLGLLGLLRRRRA